MAGIAHPSTYFGRVRLQELDREAQGEARQCLEVESRAREALDAEASARQRALHAEARASKLDHEAKNLRCGALNFQKVSFK